MKTLVIADCDHADFAEERAVCLENGVQFQKLSLKTQQEAAQALQACEVIGVQYLPVTEELLRKLPKLRCIVRYGVGVDNIDLSAASARNIAVCNVPDYGVQEVASHAFAMMMALTRKLKLMDDAVHAGHWDYTKSMPILRYSEMTVGVIGYGRIGRAFACLAHALGCRIAVYDVLFPPTLSEQERAQYNIEDHVELMDLQTLLEKSHVISLHAPLNKENGGCIGKSQLEQMRPDAVLINVSRGGLVDEQALYEALCRGVIAGAGIDTWTKEPIQEKHPLLQLEQVIATPHMAWYSEQASSDLKRKLAEEGVRALNGEPLYWQVNKVK